VLRSGDKIYLTATPGNLAKFFQHLGVFRRQAASAMIVGASKICYYLTSELLNMGMDVKIIDRDKSRCVEMSERLPGALVIVGDGTDTELLQEEGIQQTDAFVAITGLDEANILMGLSAARVTNDNCKIVTKINRRSLVELVSNQEEIGCVVSAASVTTEMIVQYVRAMESAAAVQIKAIHHLMEGEVEALECGVLPNEDFIGVPLKDLKMKPGILLAGIVRRNGQIIIPSGNDAMQAYDDVIIVTKKHDIQKIRDILL
jgi:trk system potassium uptake protein TrkA